MSWLLLVPFALQAIFVFIDEFYCHQKREIPGWERVGHPLDTLTIFLVFIFVSVAPFSERNFIYFLILAIFSCFFVTKDEFVHTKYCDGLENWLHSVLFLVHPLVFLSTAFLWMGRYGMILRVNCILVGLYGFYQAIYWNLIEPRRLKKTLLSNI